MQNALPKLISKQSASYELPARVKYLFSNLNLIKLTSQSSNQKRSLKRINLENIQCLKNKVKLLENQPIINFGQSQHHYIICSILGILLILIFFRKRCYFFVQNMKRKTSTPEPNGSCNSASSRCTLQTWLWEVLRQQISFAFPWCKTRGCTCFPVPSISRWTRHWASIEHQYIIQLK